MELSRFLQILKMFFESNIDVGDSGRQSAKNFIQNILTWFTKDNEDNSFIPINASTDKLARIYSGSDQISKIHASQLLEYLDCATFEDYYYNSDITEDAEEALITEFSKNGIVIKNVPNDLTFVLREILINVVNAPKKKSIRYAKFVSGGKVLIGGKILNLPKQLEMPDDIDYKENDYVDALLEVYSQAEKIDKITILDLDSMSKKYQEHFKVQRKLYYMAESVLHQIRDSHLFTDGVQEFQEVENETLSLISSTLTEQYKNAFERVNTTLHFIINVPSWKSHLAQGGNGLIGGAEKQGIIHMLVNKGKVKWIYDYDTNI